jgi:hypothetical protein
MLSLDTSSCCSVVASPPPSLLLLLLLLCVCVRVRVDARDARGRVSALRHVVVLLSVRPLRHSLAVCSCCVVVVLLCVPSACSHVHGVAAVVTCMSVAVSLACMVGWRRQVPVGCGFVVRGSLAHGVVDERHHAVCCLSFDLI